MKNFLASIRLTFIISAVSLIVSACNTQPSKESSNTEFDIVILNGRVIDPETGLDAIRNVGIKGGEIGLITEASITGIKTIDASEKIVSPGFIDIHTHSNDIPGQRLQAFDGVTTGLELESGMLPINDWYDRMAKRGNIINYGASAAWTFARIGAMVEDHEPMEASLAWYLKMFKYSNWVTDVSTDEQLESIIALLQEGLDQGAIGIGVNSGYAPGTGGKELMAIWKLAKENKVPVSTHIREWSMVDPKSSVEGVSTIVGLAATTGARTNICHTNSTALGDGKEVIPLLTVARERGIDIHAEAYPYGMGSFPVSSAIFMFGQQKFMKRMGTDFTKVRLLNSSRNIKDEEDMRAEQKSDPGQGVVYSYLDESDPKDEAVLQASIEPSWIGVASDAVPLVYPNGDFVTTEDWPLPDSANTNPRTAGTFSRFLGKWVREKQIMDWPDAIAKMTLIPVQLFDGMVPAMERKGRLQEGMDADITIFDPNTIIDRSTIEASTTPSQGVEYLIVNGEMVIDEGQMDFDLRAGQPIRRPVKTN